MLDAFNTAFGKGGHDSVEGHSTTGHCIAGVIIGPHGRGRRVFGRRRGRNTARRGRGKGNGCGRGVFVREGKVGEEGQGVESVCNNLT